MKTINCISQVILVSATALLFSCNNDKKEKTEETALTRTENNEHVLSARMDSIEGTFQKTLDEISGNLKTIREKEGALADNSIYKGEGKSMSRREEILNHISAINTLMEENKKKIDELNTQISSFNGAKKRWKKEVQKMEELLNQKESDIASIREQLNQQLAVVEERNATIDERNNKISELESSNQQTNAKAVALDNELHKAFYTVGTYKDFKKHHVVEKEGGVLGLGSTETLKPDFEKAGFKEVDTRQATGIVINGRKAKLVTHHPVDSYELKTEDKETAYLTIKDPDKFWSASKYLVVEVK